MSEKAVGGGGAEPGGVRSCVHREFKSRGVALDGGAVQDGVDC